MYNTPMNTNAGYPPVYDSPQMMQPGMGGGGMAMGQPVMAPNIITIGTGGTACPVCGHVGPSIPRYTMGCAAWSWCCCLFWTTFFLWLIPICSSGCKDVEQLCDRCGAVKGVIPANCC